MQLDRDVPLAPLTTLRLGGPAAQVATLTREADVPDALGEAARLGASPLVLGGGSNLVVADEGYDGLVLRVAILGEDVVVRDGVAHVRLGAGEPWDGFVARAVASGLSGVECLAGIPGLVGATPIQNVGAYGQEVADTIESVRAYDRERGAFVDLTAAECAFGYRSSVLKATARFVVTAVGFALRVSDESAALRYAELCRALGAREGDRAPLPAVRDAVLRLRRAKGMVVDPSDPESVSAGSFFVNPVVDDAGLARIVASADGADVPRHAAPSGRWKVPAAWLIERAGFTRGHALGRVRVSRRHALALVNDGGATTEELLVLARAIVRAVDARFGVTLTPEAVLVGCSL